MHKDLCNVIPLYKGKNMQNNTTAYSGIQHKKDGGYSETKKRNVFIQVEIEEFQRYLWYFISSVAWFIIFLAFLFKYEILYDTCLKSVSLKGQVLLKFDMGSIPSIWGCQLPEGFLYDDKFSWLKGLETNSYSPIALFKNITGTISEPMMKILNEYYLPLLRL